MKLRIALLILLTFCAAHSSDKKIIGLLGIRNESRCIEQCLRALALYTDAIVVLDDASQDNTLEIVRSLADECNIERIITKDVWYRDEPGDRNKQLAAGRELGGTHFIVIDADEMFTANCTKNNFLRTIILQLRPGDRLLLPKFQVWKNIDTYRFYPPRQQAIIFGDDGISQYHSDFIHTPRLPRDLKKGPFLELAQNDNEFGILHFAALDYHALALKYAWYKCLQKVRNPAYDVADSNRFYDKLLSDENVTLYKVKKEWLEGYSFFKEKAFYVTRESEVKQIKQWFDEYGLDYFADFDFWHIDWNAEFMRTNCLAPPEEFVD